VESDLAPISSLDDPVRRRLYELIRARGQPVTRDDAAHEAGIARPLAAYHLDKLVRAGLLSAAYQRPPGRTGPGAGRPAKVYRPSGSEFTVSVPPREYELAARVLLRGVAADQTGVSEAAVTSAARRTGAELARPAAAHEGVRGERALTEVLTRHGFEPAADESNVIRLRNCPFHQLAEAHRQLVCHMNLALVEGIVAGLEQPRLRPVLDPRPGECCVAIEEVSGLPG
jgi:predicted ArsR family transcriptional regulator